MANLRIIAVRDPEMGWHVDRIGNWDMRAIRRAGIEWRDATPEEITRYREARK